ncbi:MAG: M20/M25/M40 family metallo-hydrolase [Bacteroidetes bacterium]|nr:M20/M25/M40 family metallo-hydrolase [Bacteroidota bacterium]
MKIRLHPILISILFYSSILYSQESTFQKILMMTNSVSENNLISHIKNLENAGGYFSRVNFTPGNDSAAVYIKNSFLLIPKLSKVELDTFFIPSASSPYNSKPIFNIVATIKGKGDSTGIYIIGAHYDCSASRIGSTTWNNQWKTIKAPGADDNATGVAAILEIARILTDTTINFTSDYTIKLIAFGAEESGPAYSHAGSHPGSSHYASLAKQRKEKILGMFSVDMIGYNRSYDYTALVSDNNSQWLGEKLVDANNLYSIGLKINSSPFPQANYSDHQSFWNEGYRGILLIENAPPWNDSVFYKANPYYHTSYDTLGTVNIQLVKKVTQLTLATTASLGARLTDVYHEEQLNLSKDFYLSQNYPNPFNPSTTINYQIHETGFVKLKVYDILGNLIATIVNQVQSAGRYSVLFESHQYNNSKILSCGVYIYQLQTGNIISTKKMILMK